MRYRYEAVDRSGIPIHGTMEAADEAELSVLLQQRAQRLVSAEELSLNHLIEVQKELLPRLVQLRLGEHMREALLTGLPAHQVVRAVAHEPLRGPMVGMIPWLYGIGVAALVTFCGLYWLTGHYVRVIVALLAGTFGLVPLLHLLVRTIYETQPRNVLLRLARQLESGATINPHLTDVMPGEIRAVMRSDVSDEEKSRVATELMPRVLSARLKSHQFVGSFVGPLVLCSLVLAGLHALLLVIVPQFKSMFDDFGVEVPLVTKALIRLSNAVGMFGIYGWVFAAMSLALLIVLIGVLLTSIRGSEVMESVPLFGISFRWAMQARVARVMSAMIRQGCPYPETIRVATAAGGFVNVRKAGAAIAQAMESGHAKPPAGTTAKLSGLPISMLFTASKQTDRKEREASIAATFQGLSEMLDSAAVGQGMLFSIILQWATVLFLGVVVGTTVLALFWPLVNLMGLLS